MSQPRNHVRTGCKKLKAIDSVPLCFVCLVCFFLLLLLPFALAGAARLIRDIGFQQQQKKEAFSAEQCGAFICIKCYSALFTKLCFMSLRLETHWRRFSHIKYLQSHCSKHANILVGFYGCSSRTRKCRFACRRLADVNSMKLTDVTRLFILIDVADFFKSRRQFKWLPRCFIHLGGLVGKGIDVPSSHLYAISPNCFLFVYSWHAGRVRFNPCFQFAAMSSVICMHMFKKDARKPDNVFIVDLGQFII